MVNAGRAFSPQPAGTVGSRRKAAPETCRPRVLVVDDDSEILRDVTRMLSPRFHVTAVDSAVQAEILLHAFSYQAVLSGHREEAPGGLQLLERVRERHPLVRRIALAGSGSMELALHSAAGLIDHLLWKPVCPDDLDRALDEVRTA